MMERASKSLTLSGLSGVGAGVIALATALLFSIRLARPFLPGGVLGIVLLFLGHLWLVPGVQQLFYGASLSAAGSFTFGEIRYLGAAEAALGIVSALLPAQALLFWAAGFGLLHRLNPVFGGGDPWNRMTPFFLIMNFVLQSTLTPNLKPAGIRMESHRTAITRPLLAAVVLASRCAGDPIPRPSYPVSTWTARPRGSTSIHGIPHPSAPMPSLQAWNTSRASASRLVREHVPALLRAGGHP